MIRSELLQSLSKANPELRADDVERIVDVFFDEIAQRLAEGGRVELRGFGATRARVKRWMCPESGCPFLSRARKCARALTSDFGRLMMQGKG